MSEFRRTLNEIKILRMEMEKLQQGESDKKDDAEESLEILEWNKLMEKVLSLRRMDLIILHSKLEVMVFSGQVVKLVTCTKNRERRKTI